MIEPQIKFTTSKVRLIYYFYHKELQCKGGFDHKARK